MQYIIHIALNDLRIFFSERGNIIGLTIVPIFMTIALGLAFGGAIDGSENSEPIKYHVDVIDNDQSDRSGEFVQRLRETGIMTLCPIDCEDIANLDIETSIQRLEEDVVIALLVIPQSFEADLEAGKTADIIFYTNETLQTGNPVGAAVSSVIERMNGAAIASQVGGLIGDKLGDGFASDETRQEFMQAVAGRARELIDNEPLVVRYILTEQGEQSSAEVGTGFGQSVPGIGAMQVLFTVLGGLVTLVREHKQWTLQRLAVLPITRSHILAGKILSYFLLGMIQYAILLVVGLIVGVDYGDSLLALLLLISAFVLCVTALTFAVATRVTTEDQANSLSTLLGLVLAPLGGAWWPLAIVPDFMNVLGHLSPVAWVMDGFNDLIFFGGGLIEILPEVGVLVVASAVLFFIGVRGFKIGD